VRPAPALGTPVLIKWDEYDAMGQVVWVRENCCGIRFDRLLPEGVIGATTENEARRTGPTATVSNIPLGARRSGKRLSKP
jgi:hypothetical protein